MLVYDNSTAEEFKDDRDFFLEKLKDVDEDFEYKELLLGKTWKIFLTLAIKSKKVAERYHLLVLTTLHSWRG